MTKEEIVKKYFNTVYRLALSQTKNKAYADDVTQDVFLRFLNKDRGFDSEEHIKAWLLRVTINCSKSIFLSSWFKKCVPLSEELTFDTEEKSDVYYAVAELPPKYRTPIHLFYYEELQINEIAKNHYTTILYESPFRLVKTLQQLAEVCGPERRVSVARELTKIYEENARGTLEEVINYFSQKEVKGEIVIVLEGIDKE